jgi:hypothetical protein
VRYMDVALVRLSSQSAGPFNSLDLSDDASNLRPSVDLGDTVGMLSDSCVV